MEVLDTTIANVALRYIAGGLSSAVTDSEWVITSYLAANAIILPISGWLAAHLGRRNYFLLSIAVFTISSGLCGMATSLDQLILFRVMQGLAGGGLQPSSQGILLDTFPPEKAGRRANPLWRRRPNRSRDRPDPGRLDHRPIFLALDLLHQSSGRRACLLPLLAHGAGPRISPRARMELKKQPLQFDSIGLGLLVLTIVCWEVLLSKGQEWDWFSDAFGRVQTLVTLFLLGAPLWSFGKRVTRARS